jgi:hypothetical protein
MTATLKSPRSIFLEAIEKHSPDEWPQFVDSACGGDPLVRERVTRLLGALGRLDGFMARPAAPTPAAEAAPGDWSGQTIGRYKLLEQVGEGGMGVVYVAEQTQPVRRRVALKIIKPGMDTRQVIARFEAERQALAMMDHPNIARVHDGGATNSGRPYFVMELVRGMTITECRQSRLESDCRGHCRQRDRRVDRRYPQRPRLSRLGRGKPAVRQPETRPAVLHSTAATATPKTS